MDSRVRLRARALALLATCCAPLTWACGGLDVRDAAILDDDDATSEAAGGSAGDGAPSDPTTSNGGPESTLDDSGGSGGSPRPSVDLGAGAGGGTGGDGAAAPGSYAQPDDAQPDDAQPDDRPTIDLDPSDDEIFPLLWSVGAEGTGPGFFDDARFVAVDGAGTIYVAEFETDGPARVQLFDPDGNFVDQWFTQSEAIVTDMDANRDGVLFILQSGVIERYQGSSGTYLGSYDVPGGVDAIGVGPDDGLVVVDRERLLRLNEAGDVIYESDAIADVLDRSIFINDAAVDGAGNVFVVDTFELGAFKFDGRGVFVDRIGIEGDGPGLIESGANAVTVDGRGRIYLPDFDGLEVFEPSGQPFGQLTRFGLSFGAAVTPADELVAIDRNGAKLVKYDLSP